MKAIIVLIINVLLVTAINNTKDMHATAENIYISYNNTSNNNNNNAELISRQTSAISV